MYISKKNAKARNSIMLKYLLYQMLMLRKDGKGSGKELKNIVEEQKKEMLLMHQMIDGGYGISKEGWIFSSKM